MPSRAILAVVPRPRAIVEPVATGHLRTLRWAVAGLVGLAACQAAPTASSLPEHYVLRLEARSTGSFEGRGQAAWVADVVAQGLAHARWFRAEGNAPALEGRLRFETLTTAEGVPVLHAHLVVVPDPVLAAHLEAAGEALEATVELERRDHTVELRRDLPVAVERAVALVDAKLTTVRGTPADLEALLTQDDPEIVLVALDGIARRQLRELGDVVFAQVDHPEERVALRAVECLGVVGRAEHARGLVQGARLADPAHANRLYDALANLGGEDARGFLTFAARNEDDPELASLAERALAQLEAKQPTRVAGSARAVPRGHRQ
jgi:hypothetical protein